MRFSDNERGQSAPNQPESFDHEPRPIGLDPIGIDLSQPDRAPAGISEMITEISGSKLVGDIFTPTRHFAVMYVSGHGDDYVELAGDDKKDRTILMPGKSHDLSDEGSMGKCTITFSWDKRSLSVGSDNPDDAYCIFTRVIVVDRSKPDDTWEPYYPSDDPEY